MGSFFTNVQVRTRDAARAIEALRAIAKKDGLVATDDASGADRTMLVLAEGDWISVYDEGCEGQNQDALDALAAALSKKTRGPAVTILVHDSDVLELRLFRDGKRIDRIQ